MFKFRVLELQNISNKKGERIMKKYILLLLLLFTSVNLYAVTLYTPNGKSFNTHDEGRASYDDTWFEAYKDSLFGPGKLYPNSEVLGEWEEGLWEYNCHVFAWNNWQGAERWDSESDMWTLGKPSPYNLLWRGHPAVWYTDSDNPIGIVSYIVTTTQSEASIITYKSGSTITHSARIVGDGTRYISKWGPSPIVNHPPTEVPISYGSTYKFYKINPAYRPIGSGDPAGRDWQTISNALSGITSGSRIAILSGGTYSESPTLTTDNVIIDGGDASTTTINGDVTIQNAEYSTLRNFTVNDEIHVNSGHHNEISNLITKERTVWNNSSYGNILNVFADHGDKYGIKIYQSYNMYIDYFESFDGSKYGIYANSYSSLDLWTVGSYYNNQITDKTFAVQITNHSIGDLLYTYFCDNLYDIWNASGPVGETDVYANYCIWSDDPNNTTYGDVVFYPTSGWYDCGAMAKRSGLNEPSNVNYDIQNTESGNTDFDEALEIFKDLRMQSKLDDSFIKDEHIQEYQEAIDKLKKVVYESTDDSIAVSALVYLSWCYKEINGSDVYIEYLEFLIKDKKYTGELKYHAKMLFASENVLNKEYAIALQQYDEVLNTCSINDILVESLYGKGIIYLYYLNEKDKAIGVFKELVEKYPDNPTAESAMDELENIGENFYVSEDNELSPSEFTIENYPNPFNPKTQIRFSLPEAVHVKIQVYNSIGQLVKTLVNTNMEAGNHEIEFNAKGMASGVYMYRFEAGEFRDVKKMLLIK